MLIRTHQGREPNATAGDSTAAPPPSPWRRRLLSPGRQARGIAATAIFAVASSMALVALAAPAAHADTTTQAGGRIITTVYCNASRKVLGTRVGVQAERGFTQQTVYVQAEVYSYRDGQWYPGTSGYLTATGPTLTTLQMPSSTGSDVSLAGVPRGRYFVRAAVWFWRNGAWAGPFYDTPAVYEQIEVGYSGWRSSYTCYV